MEQSSFCRRGQSIQGIRSFPFFEEFIELLGVHQRLIFQNQVQHLFYCFCISKKIQLIMEQKGCLTSCGQNISRESLQQVILNDPLILCCRNKLTERSKYEGLKQQKDRKTSFFRTILKHLKKENISSRDETAGQMLMNLQKKLSKNTISSDDIKELTSKYGSYISEYLKSQKIYQDILFNNKSQANKAFYILHLGQISLDSVLAKLQNYSFFVRQDLESEIKRIIKAYYDEFVFKSMETKMETKTERSVIIEDEAELFSVLNLRKKPLDLDMLSQSSPFCGDIFQQSWEAKKIFQLNEIFY